MGGKHSSMWIIKCGSAEFKGERQQHLPSPRSSSPTGTGRGAIVVAPVGIVVIVALVLSLTVRIEEQGVWHFDFSSGDRGPVFFGGGSHRSN